MYPEGFKGNTDIDYANLIHELNFVKAIKIQFMLMLVFSCEFFISKLF